jgi:hypothetical protein
MPAPQTTHSRKQAVARPGQVSDDATLHDTMNFVNSMTAVGDGTDELLFGTFVALETDNTVKRLDAQADKIAGVVVLNDAYAKDTQLGDVGVKPTQVVECMRRGRIWVKLNETVAAGDAVRYYAKAVTNMNQGAFRTTDPTGTDTVLIATGARFVTGGTTATGAELEFDCLLMTFTADS